MVEHPIKNLGTPRSSAVIMRSRHAGGGIGVDRDVVQCCASRVLLESTCQHFL